MAMLHIDFSEIKDVSYKIPPEDLKMLLSPPPDEELGE
jgi:hypothetical protein